MRGEGPKAVGVALIYGMPVRSLRRLWIVSEGELEGPTWEIEFDSHELQRYINNL